METKIVDEETRYDRQVRLWGASTQRQLKLTHVYFDGIAGASSEMAKNLALAGVNSIVVKDNNTITSSDYHNNFLVQSSRNEADSKNVRSRGSVAATALRSLNPFVQIRCDEQEEEEELEYLEERIHTDRNDKNNNLRTSKVGSKDGILVCVVQVKTLREMHTAISQFALAEMLLLSYTIDKTIVATFILYAHHNNEKEENELVESVIKSNDVSSNNNKNDCYHTKNHMFGKQLHSLLYEVSKTERLPRQMQRALLQLHMSEMMHTGNVNSDNCCVGNPHKTINTKITTNSVMTCAMNTVEMLKLYALTPEDIAASVTYLSQLCTCADKCSSAKCDSIAQSQTDAITATMCGAALAQFLILQIGSFEIQNCHNNEQKKNSVHDDDDCTADKANYTQRYDSQWLLCDGALPALMIDQ